MQNFVEFNAVKFLQSAKKWEAMKKRLEKDLEDITILKGTSDNPIRSGNISDPVSNIASERELIIEKIDKINKYQRILDYALEQLSEQHREVIEAFFFKGGMIHQNAKKVAQKYGLSYPKGVYKLRREALELIKDICYK